MLISGVLGIVGNQVVAETTPDHSSTSLRKLPHVQARSQSYCQHRRPAKAGAQGHAHNVVPGCPPRTAGAAGRSGDRGHDEKPQYKYVEQNRRLLKTDTSLPEPADVPVPAEQHHSFTMRHTFIAADNVEQQLLCTRDPTASIADCMPPQDGSIDKLLAIPSAETLRRELAIKRELANSYRILMANSCRTPVHHVHESEQSAEILESDSFADLRRTAFRGRSAIPARLPAALALWDWLSDDRCSV
jgi:hypothetical protein